ncbi:MAG TPA: DMT family transporter [Granulicella sp.]
MRPSLKAHLLLVGVVAVWGSTFALVKNALADASPLVFNLLRMSLATVALVVVNRRDLRKLTPRTLLAGVVVGTFLGAGYQLQTAGLAHTTAAKSAFITGLVVVFVPLLTAIPALRPQGAHAPSPATLAGAALAFAGLLLLTTPSGTAFLRLFESIGLGDLLTLGCAIAFAGHLLALAHASLHLPAGLAATIQIGAASVLMAVTFPLGGQPVLHITARLIATLLLTSLLATAAAFTVQSYAQQHMAPTHTALILTLEPVFAWLISLLVLHEHFGRRSMTGAALILAGIAVIELLPANRAAVAPEIPA